VKEYVPFESQTKISNEDKFDYEILIKDPYNPYRRSKYCNLLFTYNPNENITITTKIIPTLKTSGKYNYDYWKYDVNKKCIKCIARKAYNLSTNFIISNIINNCNTVNSNDYNLMNLVGSIGLNYGNYIIGSYDKKCTKFCDDTQLNMISDSPCNIFYPFSSIYPNSSKSNIPLNRMVEITINSKNGFYDDIFLNGNCSCIAKQLMGSFYQTYLSLTLDRYTIRQCTRSFDNYTFKNSASLDSIHSFTRPINTIHDITIFDLVDPLFDSDFRKHYRSRNKTRTSKRFIRCNNCGNIHLVADNSCNQKKIVSIKNIMFEDKFDEYTTISNGTTNIIKNHVDAHELFFQL
jgi:hypothetical protein